MSRAKHRAAKLLTGESTFKQFLISAFGSKHEDPVLWFTFLCSLHFSPWAVAATVAQISRKPGMLPSGWKPQLAGSSQPTLSHQQRLAVAIAALEEGKKPALSTKLRRLNPGQELFVELLLREFETALKTGQASFFRSMAEALETINQGKFADQARLLVYFHCFEIVDGKPVRKAFIPSPRSIMAFLKQHGVSVDERTIRRMRTELGIVNAGKRGRPVKAKLEKPLESGR